MVTDASGEGWGIVLPYAHYSGRFGTSLPQAHIVLQEMITIWILPLIPNLTAVMVHTDTLASLRVLRRGFSRTVLLDRLSRVV